MVRYASVLTGLLLATAPAAASDYSASLAAPTSSRFITRDIVWNCGAAACQGATDESRPLVLCESLAKHAGRIENFLVDGRSFTPSELTRCNASARPQAGQPLAGK